MSLLGTLAIGAGTSIATNVAGQAQGMATNLVGNLTGGITNAVSGIVGNITSGISDLFGGSSGTGANKVTLKNTKNVGDPFFHGATIGGKQYSMDYVTLAVTGKAMSNEKSTEAKSVLFFNSIKPFLDMVLRGEANFPDAFDDDKPVMDYLAPYWSKIVVVSGKDKIYGPVKQPAIIQTTAPKATTSTATAVSTPKVSNPIKANALSKLESTLSTSTKPQVKQASMNPILIVVLILVFFGMKK